MSEELRKLAQAATPGPWRVYSRTCRAGDVRGGQYVHGADPYADLVAQDATMRDSAFIAAANPSAVVALLDERDSLATQLEQMRRERDEEREERKRFQGKVNFTLGRAYEAERERDEARAALAEARATNAKLHRRAQGVGTGKPEDAETIRRLRAEVRATAKHAGYVAGHVYRLQMATNFAQHATSMAVRERDEARAKAERFHEAVIEARRGLGPGSERFAAMEQHRDRVIGELDATWKSLGETGRGRGVTLPERAAKVVAVRDALHAKLARIREVADRQHQVQCSELLRIIDEKEGGP